MSDECLNDSIAQSLYSFSQIPINSAIERADNGSFLLAEMCKIFQGRIDLEDLEINYSMKVSRPNLYESEIRSSTMERALGYFKNYYLFLSREQASFRKALDEEVVFEIDTFNAKRTADMMFQKKEINRATTDVETAMAALTHAKKNHLKTVDQIQLTKDRIAFLDITIEQNAKLNEEKKAEKEREKKHLMGRLLSAFESTPDQDREKQVKKLNKLQNELLHCEKDIQMKKLSLLEKIHYRDELYQKAKEVFALQEKVRLQKMQKSLQRFCTLERSYLESRIKLIVALEEGAVKSLNADEDIKLYVKQEKRPEVSHQSSKALALLDWDYNRRKAKPEVDSEGDNSVWRDVEGAAPSNFFTSRQPFEDLMSAIQAEDDFITLNSPESSSSIADKESPVEEAKESVESTPTLTRDALNDSVSSILNEIFCDQSKGDNGCEVLKEESCRKVLEEREARELFLQVLDERRMRNSLLLPRSFDNLTLAMKVFLDECIVGREVDLALRIANMANTFHKSLQPLATCKKDEDEQKELKDEDAVTIDNDKKNVESEVRHYVQSEGIIRRHVIWRLPGFWEDALLEGVKNQLNHMEPILWDELDEDTVRGSVTGVHNVIFGQLGTMSFTMHEVGLSRLEVEKLIVSMSVGAQLSEDQHLELMKSISLSYKNDIATDDATQADIESSSEPIEYELSTEQTEIQVNSAVSQPCETLGYSPNMNDRSVEEFGML